MRIAEDGMAERHAWAVLATASGVGPAGLLWLVGRFGTARELLRIASRPNGPRLVVHEAAMRQPAVIEPAAWRLTLEIAQAIARAARDGPHLVRRIERVGLRVMTVDDIDYPPRLLGIDEPIPLLYVRGDVAALTAERSVAVVGTRHPTEAGLRLAGQIAAAIGEAGGVVVSGLAYGIDAAAHQAAVDGRRPTVAVLGSGHARLYPALHRDLGERILATGGCVISEHPPDAPGAAHTFPQRNRIISGLADATVVVEAPQQSGALITANHALRQGRECFFTPGPIGARVSAGSLQYLRDFPDRARIVASVPMLLADLGFDVEVQQAVAPASVATSSVERQLVELIVAGAATVDQLVGSTGLAVSTVLSALTLLEMRGLIVGAYGRYRPGEALRDRATPRRRTGR
jgi:DNA processing protein